jgi:hypothetical protein
VIPLIPDQLAGVGPILGINQIEIVQNNSR